MKRNKPRNSQASFFSDDLPYELIIEITKNLNPKEAAAFAQTSKRHAQLTENHVEYRDIRQGYAILKNSLKELNVRETNLLRSAGGLIALGRRLFSIEHFKKLNVFGQNQVLTHNVITALQEGFITIKNIQEMTRYQLRRLNDSNLLSALQEKFLSIEKYMVVPTSRHIDVLISENALTGLREKLFTVDDLVKMSADHAEAITSDTGLVALREGLVKIEQVKDMSLDELVSISDEEELEKLRGNHSTYRSG